MSFSWIEYYNLAIELVEKETEAAFRSSISRVYYAAFNILRLRAGYNSRSVKAELSHTKFIDEFKNISDRVLSKFPNLEEEKILYIGNQLDNLRRLRNKADYDGTKSFDKRNAIDACDQVEFILELLEEAEE